MLSFAVLCPTHHPNHSNRLGWTLILQPSKHHQWSWNLENLDELATLPQVDISKISLQACPSHLSSPPFGRGACDRHRWEATSTPWSNDLSHWSRVPPAAEFSEAWEVDNSSPVGCLKQRVGQFPYDPIISHLRLQIAAIWSDLVSCSCNLASVLFIR